MANKPPGKVISVYSHKGGVGKTTILKELSDSYITSINEKTTKLLLIDCDPQCNLTSSMIAGHTLINTSWTFLNIFGMQEEDPKDPYRICESPIVDLYFGDDEDTEFTQVMSTMFVTRKKANTLGKFTKRLGSLKEKYDIIFLDLNPSLSTLNKTLLLLSDTIICPVLPDNFSLSGLNKLVKFLFDSRDLSEQFGNNVTLLGFCLNQSRFRIDTLTKPSQFFKTLFKQQNVTCLATTPHIPEGTMHSIPHRNIIISGKDNDDKIILYKKEINKIRQRINNFRSGKLDPDDGKVEPIEIPEGDYVVYVFKEDVTNFYKIGRTMAKEIEAEMSIAGIQLNKQIKRTSQLQTGNPRKLIIKHIFNNLAYEVAKELEKNLHGLFQRNKLAITGGSEWFELGPHQLGLLDYLITNRDQTVRVVLSGIVDL